MGYKGKQCSVKYFGLQITGDISLAILNGNERRLEVEALIIIRKPDRNGFALPLAAYGAGTQIFPSTERK